MRWVTLLDHTGPPQAQIDAPFPKEVWRGANCPFSGLPCCKLYVGMGASTAVGIHSTLEGEHTAELTEVLAQFFIGVLGRLGACLESVRDHPN